MSPEQARGAPPAERHAPARAVRRPAPDPVETRGLESTSAPARPVRPLSWAILGIILALHATAAWLGRQILVRHGQDDAWYILLARALREFRYVDLFVVGQPIHQLYPPGYPGLLALWSLVGGERVDSFVVLNVLASSIAIALAFLAWRRLLDERLALLVAAALAANADMVQRAGMVVSEPVFLALTMGVLWLALSQDDRSPGGRLVLMGALAIAVSLVRSIGVALVAALLLHWLLQRRWRAAAVLAAAAALTIGAWLAWTVMAPDQFVGKSYIADITRVRRTPTVLPVVVRRVVNATRFYLSKGVPSAMAAPTLPGTILDNLLIAGLIAAGMLGGTVAMLKRWRVASFYLVASVGILLLYPWLLQRFVVPLLPLIVPFIAYTLWLAGRRFGARAGAGLAAAVLAVVTLSGTVRTVDNVRQTLPCDRSGPMPPDACLPEDAVSYFAALRHIQSSTPESAVVAAAKAAPLYYYTGRLTPPVGAVFAQSNESFLPFLREVGADYVLLGRLHSVESRSLVRSVRANCAALELVRTFPPSTFLFRVANTPSAGSADESCAAAARYEGRWDNSLQ